MGLKKRKLYTAMLSTAICCSMVLGGCASEGKSGTGQGAVSEGNVSGKETENNTDAIGEDSQINAGTAEGTYKPSELTMPSQESYEFPYMGLKFSLPAGLKECMDKKEAAMINLEEATEDATAISYALISWKGMTAEQRDKEVNSGGNEFYDWVDSLTGIGAIGAYQENQVEKLDELTGCTEHKEIGKSKDGVYTYYLSTNPEADSALLKEINNMSYELTDIVPLQEYMASEEEEEAGGQNSDVGEFSMQDVEGQTYTQQMFAEYDLTMVNVFTTWCSPCVNEIPDLQKLRNEMKDKGVNVVGIVLDCIDSSGNADEEVIEKAKTLAERTGADYPFLIPDKGYLNGRLSGINAVPETFFIDKEGNIVGETYSGSHSFEEWKEIVETELKGAVQ